MHVLSIDLGGSHATCAVVGAGGVEAEVSFATDAASLAALLGPLGHALEDCIERSRITLRDLGGLSLGFPGVVDGNTGQILSVLNKYLDAPTLDLVGWAAESFGVPLRIENDACMALLGEAARGAAKGASDIVMVTLGTGIGGAAMLDGTLLRSRAGQAGCLGGHLPVNFKGRLCACGAIGCAEAEASTAVLPIMCREHAGFADSLLAREPVLHFEALFHALDAGDPVAAEVLDFCLAVWSSLTVGLIHAYGPQVVVFGGGVMARAAHILPRIRSYVEQHAWRTTRGLPRIEQALLGRHAALLGGYTLFAADLPAYVDLR